MTAYGIFGDVEASPKLVRAALSDFLEAHQRCTPDDEFWLKIGVRDAGVKIYDEILDWAVRNKVYTEVVTPSPKCATYVEPAKITVTPAFMLSVVDAIRHERNGKILALVGDETPRTDVLRALAKAKDNGTEIRDLAEAGLSLIRFKGDDPPQPLEDTTTMPKKTQEPEEEAEYTLAELGEFADDDSDPDTAEQAQKLLTDAAGEAGIDPDDYETWTELGTVLEEAKANADDAEPDEEDEDQDEDGDEDEEETEDEPDEPEDEGLTRESLVGKDIGEIKALAKAAGIEGYTKMRRELLIKALLGEEEAESPPAAPSTAPAKKAAGAAKKRAASSPASNGDAGPGGSGITDDDIARIAGAVVSKLVALLSAG
jgi:hypothetical protein